MPSDGVCVLSLTDQERELLRVVLMGDFELGARIDDTPTGEAVGFASAELGLLDDIVAIELEHTNDPSQRRTMKRVRERIARILNL